MSLGGCPTSERSRRTCAGVLSLAFLLLAKEISKRKPRLLPPSWVSSWACMLRLEVLLGRAAGSLVLLCRGAAYFRPA